MRESIRIQYLFVFVYGANLFVPYLYHGFASIRVYSYLFVSILCISIRVYSCLFRRSARKHFFVPVYAYSNLHWFEQLVVASVHQGDLPTAP